MVQIFTHILVVYDHPKKAILCLLDSGSISSLLNYDVANQNVKSKERHKEVWNTQGGTFAIFQNYYPRPSTSAVHHSPKLQSRNALIQKEEGWEV